MAVGLFGCSMLISCSSAIVMGACALGAAIFCSKKK